MTKYFIADPIVFKAVRFIDVIVTGGKDLADAVRISSKHYKIEEDVLKDEYVKFNTERTDKVVIITTCPSCKSTLTLSKLPQKSNSQEQLRETPFGKTELLADAESDKEWID